MALRIRGFVVSDLAPLMHPACLKERQRVVRGTGTWLRAE